MSVTKVSVSKTASIFFNSILFDEKVNLVGAFRKSKLKIPNRFQKHWQKQHTNQRKMGIFTQKQFWFLV